MTIKIKSPRAWANPDWMTVAFNTKAKGEVPVRIVRESDWRKLMKLVRVAEDMDAKGGHWGPVHEALDTLRGKK